VLPGHPGLNEGYACLRQLQLQHHHLQLQTVMPHYVRMHSSCRSTFGSPEERECFQGIVDWMNNAPISAIYSHSTMTSWFYWAYNPDSGGTPPTPPHAVLLTEGILQAQSIPYIDWPRLKD
jgi:hypothetical protein